MKSSAATACLFHTKHNFVYIFIGKLGPTHLDAQTRALAAGLRFQGAGENRALSLPRFLDSGLQELACKGSWVFFLPCQLLGGIASGWFDWKEKQVPCPLGSLRLARGTGEISARSWLRFCKGCSEFRVLLFAFHAGMRRASALSAEGSVLSLAQ